MSQNETELYKELKSNIRFVDINDPEFKEFEKRVSKSDAATNRIVITEDNRIITGLDALLTAWERIPKMAFLVPIVTTATVKPFAKIAFSVYKNNLKK